MHLDLQKLKIFIFQWNSFEMTDGWKWDSLVITLSYSESNILVWHAYIAAKQEQIPLSRGYQ